MTASNVFRDGKVHIQAKKCDTCIYRPGNLMHLRPGRRQSMEAEAIAGGGVIPCHKTLDGDNAVCRGYFDVAKQHTLLQAAERMGVIVEVEPTKTGDST